MELRLSHDCDYFSIRGIVSGKSEMLLCSYYLPSTQMMTGKLIVRVSYTINNSIEVFISHMTRIISWSVIICLEGG
jgi:hypothetical protein